MWDTRFYKSIRKKLPIEADERRRIEEAPTAISIARNFIEQTKLEPRCTLLTVVPSREATEMVARHVAQATQLPIIVPRLDNLTTVDDSHLDEEIASALDACITGRGSVTPDSARRGAR
jgi:hypothetical protein